MTRSASIWLLAIQALVAIPAASQERSLTQFGNKWGWSDTNEAFVPQLVMYASPQHFHDNPSKIDADIRTFIEEHGFNGFHVGVACRWFDLHEKDCRNISGSDPPVDDRTIEALALLIQKTHAAGGMVHLWLWGDAERGLNPSVRSDWGGLNGRVDRRLQQEIASRLGPLQGWSMGYGFDLDEWVDIATLHDWHDRMQALFPQPHFLGGRPAGPNSGTSHSAFVEWNSGLGYASYEHHRPSYAVYVSAIETFSDLPTMSEDRFRVRNDGRSKDYSFSDVRRGLWHSTMAGGVANIWGNLLDGGSHELGSAPFQNRNEIKTHSRFIRGRFRKDMSRDNGPSADPRSSTLGLRAASGEHFIFYREDSDRVELRLAGMKGSRPAIAVDTRSSFQELSLGIIGPSNQVWTAPYRSDWAVAVGNFVGSGGDPGPSRRFTDQTAEVGLNIWESEDIGGWHGSYVADYDGDGDEDIFMTSHGVGQTPDSGQNALFRNDGNGRFREVAAAAGLAGGLHGRFTRELHGASWFDLDNDGDLDIYFPNTDSVVSDTSRRGYDEIHRNNGDGSFSDVSESFGLPRIDHGRRGAIAGDIDLDGDIDLVFVNAADENHNPVFPYRNVYVNEGSRFSLEDRGMEFLRWSEGITSLDFDGDGDLDFLLANEEGGGLVVWENDGNGFFTNVSSAVIRGGNDGVNGSVSVGDVDNDGDEDLYSNKGLYRNDNGIFRFDRSVAGSTENMFFADLDNDGALELVGDGLYWNDGGGGFQRSDSGVSIPSGNSLATRGGMALDYDNDGDLDLVFNISDRNQPYLKFYRNHLMEDNAGSPRVHWLQVELRKGDGQVGNPGAKIWVYRAGTSSLIGYREVRTATGFVSGPSYRQHFGLGTTAEVDISVRWPTGEESFLMNVSANQRIQIVSESTTPRAPSGLTAAAPTPTRVELSWQDNSLDEDGFKIERAEDQSGSPGSFVGIATLASGVTSFADESVAAGTTYWYRVSAFNSFGASAPSNLIQQRTPSGNELVVSGLSPGHYRVAALRRGDLYYIDRSYVLTAVPSILGGALWIQTANSDKNQTSESFLSFSVSKGAVVYVAFDRRASSLPHWLRSFSATGERVQVSDTMGYFNLYRKEFPAGQITLGGASAPGASFPSGKSNFVVVLLPGTVPGGPPSAASDLQVAAASTSSVELRWQDQSSDETGFRIERAPDTHGAPGSFETAGTVSADLTTFTDLSVISGATYWYRVIAFNGFGDAAPSNLVQQRLPSSGGKLTVTGLSPSGYEVAALSVGDRYYIDRSYELRAIPPILSGALWIRTANNDKAQTSPSFLSFHVSTAVEVYVAFDRRASSLPSWLSGWSFTGEQVPVSDTMGYFHLYRKSFPAGAIILGGNSASGARFSGGKSNYVVALVAEGGEPGFSITGLNPSNYRQRALAVSDPYYIDRGYVLRSVSQALWGAIWIQTANNDKHQTSEAFLSFTVSEPVTVYVAFDSRASSLPGWLQGFSATGERIEVSDSSMGFFQLYRKDFAAGDVVLGATSASGAVFPTGKSSYMLAIVGR